MPSDFNIPLSMPSWNEQVTARPQHGLLSQQAHYLQQQERIAAARAAALAEAKKPKYDGRMTLSKGPELRDIPQMYEDPNATNYGFLNNSQAEQYNPQLPPPPLSLGAPTGLMTTEGRRAYHNNFGGMSTEYSIGTKNPKINNGLLTHIPSIYDGQIVDQRTAEDMIIRNNGVDPETGRFITPGGDPEARSQGLSLTKQIARKPASLLTPSSNDGLLGRTPPPEMPDTQGRSIYEPPHGSVSPQPGSRNYGATKRQQEIIHEFIPEDFEQTGERIPRTMRNNNPVALSKTNIDWDGLSTVQDDVQLAEEDFPMAQFDNPILGARAAARNFRTKFRRGLNTVSKIIQAHLSSVRPLDEHHALVKSVSKHMGVKSSETINLDNEDQLNKFVEGVVAHEGGGWDGSATRHFIDSGIVQTGVTMALDKVKKTATKPAKDLGLPPAK